MTNSHILLTKEGQKYFNATLLAGENRQLQHCAIGSGGAYPDAPTSSQSSLTNEQARLAPVSIQLDPENPSKAILALTIDQAIHGFMFNEFGLLDEAGTLLLYACFEGIYLPTPDSPIIRDVLLRLELDFSKIGLMDLQIDPTDEFVTQSDVQTMMAMLTLEDKLVGGITSELLTKSSDEAGAYDWHLPEILKPKEVSFLSKSGYNVQYMIYKGELYTTQATGNYANNSLGIGQDDQVLSLRNFIKVPLNNVSPLKEAMCVSRSFSFALCENGDLYVWGENLSGQCGQGHTNPILLPLLVETNVSRVFHNPNNNDQGSAHSNIFFEKFDGSIWGAGDNRYGTLGLGHTNTVTTFTEITFLGKDVENLFSLGGISGSIFVQKQSGQILACGWNRHSNLGIDTTNYYSLPQDVTTNWGGLEAGDIISIRGGFGFQDETKPYSYSTTVMLRKTTEGITSIRTAGSNYYQSIGRGTNDNVNQGIPYLIPDSNEVKELSAFGGGPLSIFMVKENGDLYGWGYNYHGQLGIGTSENVSAPTLIDQNVETVLSDGFTSEIYSYRMPLFYRKADGLYSCGINNNGECGIGLVGSIHTPQKVLIPRDQKVTQMGLYNSAEGGITCLAYTEEGRLYGWGYNGGKGVDFLSSANQITAPLELPLPA